MRFQCDVMRPATAQQSRGEQKGKDQILIAGWPCKLTQTGGIEGEQAGSTFADRTYQAEGYQDPRNRMREKDYLMFEGRRLNISSIVDERMNGEYVVVECGEQVK